MDDYLKCIYDKIIGEGFTEKYKTLIEYRGSLVRRNEAWEELRTTLSPAQMELFDHYEAEQNTVDSIEAEALFEEGVEVGRRMAR